MSIVLQSYWPHSFPLPAGSSLVVFCFSLILENAQGQLLSVGFKKDCSSFLNLLATANLNLLGSKF